MKYYNTEQTINLFQSLPNSLKPFDLPQIADLCRQGILTPVFAYNSYGIEVLEYYDGNKPLIYINGVDTEPDTSRFPDPRTTYLYDDYFTHDRLTSLLDKSIDNLEIHNAMIYKSDGSGYEVVLVANPLNVNKYLNDENYSVYSDDDGYTVTLESLLFPSEQVQNYIKSKQITEQNTPEQQRIAELESQIAELQEQLRQHSSKLPNDPLQGIAKYNADKAYIINTSKALASYLWSMDNTQAIRTGDMVQQVRQVMHNIDPNLLPDDKTIRGWLSSIAPDYAKKSGKPSNNAPNEISLIMKK